MIFKIHYTLSFAIEAKSWAFKGHRKKRKSLPCKSEICSKFLLILKWSRQSLIT